MRSGRPLKVKETREYRRWFWRQDERIRRLIVGRFYFVRHAGDFGDSRHLGEGLVELRWRIGVRVYCSVKRVGGADILAVWGGSKRGQRRDIEKARAIKKRLEAGRETGRQ